MFKKMILVLVLSLVSACVNNSNTHQEEVKYKPSAITMDVSDENLALIKDYLQHNAIIRDWITNNYIDERYIQLEKSIHDEKVLSFQAFKNRNFLTFDYTNDFLLIRDSYFVYRQFYYLDNDNVQQTVTLSINNQEISDIYPIRLRINGESEEYEYIPATQTFRNPYLKSEVTIEEPMKSALIPELESAIQEYQEFEKNLKAVKAEVISLFTHDTQQYIDYSYEYLSTHFYPKMHATDNLGNTFSFTSQNYDTIVEMLKDAKILYRDIDYKIESPKFTIQLNPETFMEIFPFAIQIYDNTNMNCYAFDDSTLYDYMNNLYGYALLNAKNEEEVLNPLSDREFFDLLNQTIQEEQLFPDNHYDISLYNSNINIAYTNQELESHISCYNDEYNIVSCSFYVTKNYDFTYELTNGEKHEAYYSISYNSDTEYAYSISIYDYDYTGYHFYLRDGKLTPIYSKTAVLPEEINTKLLKQLESDILDFEEQIAKSEHTRAIITNTANTHKSECLFDTDKCEVIQSDITYEQFDEVTITTYPDEVRGYMNTIYLFIDSLDSDLIHVDEHLIQNLAFKVPYYMPMEGSYTNYTSSTAQDTLYLDEKYYKGDGYYAILKASDIDTLAKTILPNSEPLVHQSSEGDVYYASLEFIEEFYVYQRALMEGDGPSFLSKAFYFGSYTIDENGIHVKVYLLDLSGYSNQLFAKDKHGNTYRLNVHKNNERNINTFISNTLSLFSEYEFTLKEHPDSAYYIVENITKIN